jgi:hypothetical protein
MNLYVECVVHATERVCGGWCFFGTAKALTVSNGIVHVWMEKCATRDRVMLYFIGVYWWTVIWSLAHVTVFWCIDTCTNGKQ